MRSPAHAGRTGVRQHHTTLLLISVKALAEALGSPWPRLELKRAPPARRRNKGVQKFPVRFTAWQIRRTEPIRSPD